MDHCNDQLYLSPSHRHEEVQKFPTSNGTNNPPRVLNITNIHIHSRLAPWYKHTLHSNYHKLFLHTLAGYQNLPQIINRPNHFIEGKFSSRESINWHVIGWFIECQFFVFLLLGDAEKHLNPKKHVIVFTEKLVCLLFYFFYYLLICEEWRMSFVYDNENENEKVEMISCNYW